MRNSNLIHLALSASGQSTLSEFFTLETKGIGGGGRSCPQKEAKQRKIWKTYSWPFYRLKFFNRRVFTVLYVERIIPIYDLFWIGNPILSNMDVEWFKLLES
jgi:hypothetical protein